MNTGTNFLNPSLIRDKGINILVKELGLIETSYFLSLFEQGDGNWTEERKSVLGDMSLTEIKHGIQEMKTQNISVK